MEERLVQPSWQVLRLVILTDGPFFPVDNISPQLVRLSTGNMFDVSNYPSFNQALTSTRTVMVTTYTPANPVGVTCPKGN